MLEYLPKRRRISGLRIDPRKAVATQHSIADDFIPEQLFITVEPHYGISPSIIVKAGQHVLRGETLACGNADTGVIDTHASSSGTIREIAVIEIERLNGTRPTPCIVIDTDGHDAAQSDSSVVDLSNSPSRPDKLERIRRAGVVGLGGAAVSTSWKLMQRDVVPTVIINGAECEPYISCDDRLMREHAGEILAGSIAILKLAGAGQCIVAIERDKPEAIAAMRTAAAQLGDERLFLAELPSVYPAGGERQLVELLMDTEVPSGQYPADVGIVCQNVGTAYAVHRALKYDEPLIRRVVTITGGAIEQPRNVYARIGTRFADLIAHFGGYAKPPEALIVGGSMMGIAQISDAVPVTKATNCILAPDVAEFGEKQQEWPCIRCGECAGACPARLLPQELLRATENSNFEMLDSLGLVDCIECGCCDVICPSHIALTQRFIAARQVLAERQQARVFAATAQNRFDSRSQRLTQVQSAESQSQQALRADSSIAAALERVKNRGKTPDEDS